MLYKKFLSYILQGYVFSIVAIFFKYFNSRFVESWMRSTQIQRTGCMLNTCLSNRTQGFLPKFFFSCMAEAISATKIQWFIFMQYIRYLKSLENGINRHLFQRRNFLKSMHCLFTMCISLELVGEPSCVQLWVAVQRSPFKPAAYWVLVTWELGSSNMHHTQCCSTKASLLALLAAFWRRGGHSRAQWSPRRNCIFWFHGITTWRKTNRACSRNTCAGMHMKGKFKFLLCY